VDERGRKKMKKKIKRKSEKAEEGRMLGIFGPMVWSE
jgi:hypothetical protein